MTIQEMKQAAFKLGINNEDLAMYADVLPEDIDALFNEDPSVTLPPSVLWFLNQILSPIPCDSSKPSDSVVREAITYHAKKMPNSYTIQDLKKMMESTDDDTIRLELIDGVIYHLTSPDAVHQMIIGETYSQFRDYIRKKKGECIPLFAPFGVQLDCDDKTFLQPDILIVCDRDKLTRPCLYGTPDLVIEVLSPSTRRKDLEIKVPKYLNSGVKECWMIDPVKKSILVYSTTTPDIPTIYGFDSKVPVGIWDNNCEIDFNEIYEQVEFLY